MNVSAELALTALAQIRSKVDGLMTMYLSKATRGNVRDGF
jgi:hypothetical protein